MPLRLLCAAFGLVFAAAGLAAAQDRPEPIIFEPQSPTIQPQAPFQLEPPSQITLPQPAPALDARRETARPRTTDKKFWAVAAALNTAMILDTKSTFDVGYRCPTCYERNPVVRPFLPLGPAPVFAMGVAFDAGVMTVAAKMKGSSKPALRRTWWIVPVALAAGHFVAWRHNVGLVE
jgi:hypothetical protein